MPLRRAGLVRLSPIRQQSESPKIIMKVFGGLTTDRLISPYCLPLLPEGAIERALAAHTAERHKSLMTVNVEALKKGMTYA